MAALSDAIVSGDLTIRAPQVLSAIILSRSQMGASLSNINIAEIVNFCLRIDQSRALEVYIDQGRALEAFIDQSVDFSLER